MPQACVIENYRFGRDMYSQKEWMCGGAGGAVPDAGGRHLSCLEVRRLRRSRGSVPAPRIERLA